jgi:hypothetical protein
MDYGGVNLMAGKSSLPATKQQQHQLIASP